MIFLLFFYLFLACNAYAPGIALKLNERSISSLSYILTPLIISRYSGSDYGKLKLSCTDSRYDLKLSSPSNIKLDPITTTMKFLMSKEGFKVDVENLQGSINFHADLKIHGTSYSGESILIFDRAKVKFALSFKSGTYITPALSDILVDKQNINVIFTDNKLNKTLNGYKDILTDAYGCTTERFIHYLSEEMSMNGIKVTGYNPMCGFNTTLVKLPEFFNENKEVIFYLDGSIVDLKTMTRITNKYPFNFPLQKVKDNHEDQILIGDKILEGLLAGCKYEPIQYDGRNEVIKTTLNELPEIQRKYSEGEIFKAHFSLLGPLSLSISESGMMMRETDVIYTFTAVLEGKKETVFECKITISSGIESVFKNTALLFTLPNPVLNNVKVISSNIDLNGKDLRRIFQNVIYTFNKEVNEYPLTINFTTDIIPSYFGLYFKVRDLAYFDEYSDLKLAPSI